MIIKYITRLIVLLNIIFYGKGYTEDDKEDDEMKEKVIVLCTSIFVLVLVCVVAIGLKAKDKNSTKKEKKTELIEETSSELETTTEEETTTEPETEVLVDPTKPMVALTFDDGPSRENTIRILDALKAHNGRATFFLVGYNIEGNEDIIKAIADEGSEVANHTINHKQLTKITDDAELDSEIYTVRNKIVEITGQEVVPLRPPYGDVDERVMSHIQDPVILWSIDTLDWQTRDAASTIANIQENIFDGAIVLMHDIHGETADAVVQIVDWLDSQGYQMVTVSELGEYRRGGLTTGVKYGSLKPEETATAEETESVEEDTTQGEE